MNSNLLQETRKTVFLADQSESFLIYLRILLERMGFRIVPLKKGAILQDLIQVMKPDLIMLGRFLEDMEGVSALRNIRQNTAFAGVPVVMFCDSEHEECSQVTRELGEVKYLSRPVNIFQLYNVIYEIIVFSSGEKRAHLRTSFHEKVLLSHGDREIELWATSLSEGGIFVRSRNPLPAGESVTVSVQLGFDRPARFQGKVLYSKAAEADGVSNVPGIAIQFASVSPEQASQLRICILGLLVGDLLEEQRDEPIFTVVSRTNDMYEDIVLDHIRVGHELKNYQLQMKSMMDSLPFGTLMYRLQDDGQIAVVNVNPAARKRFGQGVESLEDLAARFPKRYHKNLSEIVRNLASKEGKIELRGVECQDSQMGIFDILAFQTGPGNVAVIFQDVSDRKKQDEEDLRLQKLEALGLLAGGIAHDFNNLLQQISGYASLVRISLNEPDMTEKTARMLDHVEKGVANAGNLTKQLLTFARGGDPICEPFLLKNLIVEATQFSLHGSNVSANFKFDDDLCDLEGDRGQLHQVFTNLIINAKQSMPQGGVVTVSGRNATIGEGHPVLRPGCYVIISIKDMGIGIPPKFLSKIFDPYFTTKQTGSGLGLPTAYSIVRKHGGFIDVSSFSGEGSTFDVYLPAQVRTKVISEPLRQIEIWKGAGRVLVMDDEETVRMIFREMLEMLGFEVVCVENGEAMLEVYRQAAESGQRFEVVILDLTIRGGMGGKDALEHLLKIDPTVRAFAASGYFDSTVMVEYKEYGFCGILPKPITLTALGEKLRSVLEA
ncbi:MAG: domain S-box-containing protein [Nitrospirae bacterium]|nr:domain S-box-containing protein [Nitrospirota bacterium]